MPINYDYNNNHNGVTLHDKMFKKHRMRYMQRSVMQDIELIKKPTGNISGSVPAK